MEESGLATRTVAKARFFWLQLTLPEGADPNAVQSVIDTELARIFEAGFTEQELRRAISLNPNYPTAHHWFSIYRRVKGQFDEALKESKRAQELDPLSLIIGSNLAHTYFLNNDINAATKEVQKLIELDPHFPNSHHDLGWMYLKQSRHEEAIA